MYLITITDPDGFSTVIHEPGAGPVKVEGGKISREVNKFDSLTFTIYPDSPGWGECEPFATTIVVRDVMRGRDVFDGRVIQRNPGMTSDGTPYREITCESVMGYLCDSLQMWEEEAHYGDVNGTSGLVTYLTKLLTRHNQAVEEHKRIYPGTITLQTFETSGGVTKGVDRASTWDNISNKLIGSFGGEMRVRRSETGVLYLDYAERLGVTRATRIELARNMADASSEVDPSGVITRLYPFGAKLTTTDEDGNEVETEERVTIETVNDGKPYVDDLDGVEQLGIIEGYQEWDDVTQPANLLQKAQGWLAQNNLVPVSHTFTAYDLSLLGIDPDPFEILDWYPCRNPLTGLDETLEIVSQTIDLNEPEKSTIDMGETTARLSDEIGSKPWQPDIEQMESQTNTNITNAVNKTVTNLVSAIIGSDSITQTVQEIVSQTVSEVVANVSQEALAAQQAAEQARQQAELAKAEAAQAAGITGDATVLIQESEPGAQHRNEHTLWIDTSGGGAVPKVWGDGAWVESSVVGADGAAQDAVDAEEAAQAAQEDATEAAEEALSGIGEAIEGVQQSVTTIKDQMTQLEQDSEGWDFQFQTIEETITEINGQLSTLRVETSKYIRFVDGEIIVGIEGDPFEVRIANDRIRFTQNGVEVAYVSNSKLFITDAQILNRLDIGNFAFIPRDNGNMSLVYNGS